MTQIFYISLTQSMKPFFWKESASTAFWSSSRGGRKRGKHNTYCLEYL